VQSQKTSNTKHVVNLFNFPFIIHMLKSDKQRRSHGHCKLGVLLKISSGQTKSSGQVWTLSSLPKGIWKNSEYKDPREFYSLSNEGYNSEFRSRMKKLWLVEFGWLYKIRIFYSNRFQIHFDFNFHWIECLSKFILFMHIHMQTHDIRRYYPFLAKRKGSPNIDGARVVGGKSHSSPWLVLTEWLTQTWFAYL
jgi:hypothetical protein